MTAAMNTHPVPPVWATRSVPEDGGITHEHVSMVHPRGSGWIPDAPTVLRATDVSLSVVDRRASSGWIRGEPTVQIEGGVFTVGEARLLRQALDDLLTRIDAS